MRPRNIWVSAAVDRYRIVLLSLLRAMLPCVTGKLGRRRRHKLLSSEVNVSSANVFPSPVLCIYSYFHMPKNTSSECKNFFLDRFPEFLAFPSLLAITNFQNTRGGKLSLRFLKRVRSKGLKKNFLLSSTVVKI